ncbi:MAG: hotdog fold thioesterase [Bdellovibrionales bacterium]|nr:hotdog fold thioesterase [Bdellovibrionales bacterium]
MTKAPPKLPKISADELNSRFVAKTALEALGIKFTAVTEEYLEGSMPVDARTHQPFGFLHGGASALLAESLASTGANMLVDTSVYRCFGLELNANHISAVREGTVTGRATPIHVGRTTQVWDIRISTAEGKLVCISRLTLAITPIKQN